MKLIFVLLYGLTAVSAMAANANVSASGKSGPLVLEPDRTEVLVAPRAASPTHFAATELTNFLSRAFGRGVPLVTSPREGWRQIVVGTNAWSAAEGLDPATLEKPDAFLISATPERLYLCGVDGPCSWFEQVIADGRGVGMMRGRRSSIFAVYEFLERRVGCRFYFPGELGEIVPHVDRVVVPLGTETHAPDLLIRKYYHPSSGGYHAEGGWISGNEHSYGKGLMLNWLRLRMGTFDIPCCHGINRYYFLERFGKSHPEYFALKKDGSRFMRFEGYESSRWGMSCFSSAVTNELYEDVKAYLTGQPPESRKIHRGWGGKWEWPNNLAAGRYADIMPNDSQFACQCEKCRAQYRMDRPHFMTELVWGYTRDIANRLIAEGVPGYVTQMAYATYARIPDFDLPTNIMVMVAKTGPFSIRKPEKLAEDNGQIRAWARKVGGVWIWTYPNKYGELNVPGVPTMVPRAWAAYYQQIAPDVFGIFAESECDRFFFHHLNYYVFSRLTWDIKVDTDAVLDEYYRLMYEAAAPEAKQFCEELEDVLLDQMVGQVVDTPEGPKAKAPAPYEIWTQLYSPAKLARWGALLDRGAAKLAKGSLAARRFALFRDELLGVMQRTGEAYLDQTDARRNAARLRAHPPRHNIVDWNRGWYAKARDKEVTIVSDSSIRIVSTNGSETALYYVDGRSAPELKRGARYRLSFFVKGEGIVPIRKGGGAGVTLCDAFNHSYPQTAGLIGTFDWIHQSFEFTTEPNTNDRALSYIYLRISGANGTAWFDGVSIEELPDQVVDPAECAVVVDPASSKSTLLAARDLSRMLGRRFGLPKIPVRRTPDGVKFAIVVGTNRWSAAAGVTTEGLEPGKVRVKSAPGAVYICGAGEAERYGVYAFMLREASCRFYFPGELGEVVPTASDLPLQRLDYAADLGEIKCYIAARNAKDPFLRHLDFCVHAKEPQGGEMRFQLFHQRYMSRLFGLGNASWYMGQFLKGITPEVSMRHALRLAATEPDPLVLRRVELFRDRLGGNP